ncbi:MAG: peptidase S45 [Gemmatimonadetes bacterium RIFCSPLOWO2_12_FULL_68_9]|nr:MAG: peptidase S45 [Gemmatimonadetes bacterium RIFCSPLOWO2_12_FULL_68_9]
MRLAYHVLALSTALSVLRSPLSVLRAQDRIQLPGLERPVEILKDRWGISHIYAESEHDLFFAQGYNAARDRLFQLELWRRQATGTVAEMLGPRELQRDIGTRLFKFRKDLVQELTHYHPKGAAIVNAFVAGVNAYVDQANRAPERLPLEFRLLGIRPQHWTAEVVISRHQGLLGNIGEELSTARAVVVLGPEQVKWLVGFGPGDPDLTFDQAIDPKLLSANILERYNAFRTELRFQPEDVAAPYRAAGAAEAAEDVSAAAPAASAASPAPAADIGSNNWVVSGERSESRYPMMANDPHRAQSAPSLRYWVHLVGPGWNVIGGGEPALPGVAIGHNGYGAWGLTVFSTDGEDLYVYDTNPQDPNQYRYYGQWEPMTVLREQISVRGEGERTVELKYTRHGPVVFEDREHRKAYAVRAAWMEIGGAPYLASLRMDQAKSWEEFREACNYSNIPGENMVWAGRDGTIGWQAVGIAPIRRNWSGLIPVPGDGRYEWDGFLPIKAKPHVVNPPEGYFATANNDLIPRDYGYMDAIGFEWADPYRWARVSEVLGSGRRMSVMDMMRLQTDELAIPARQLVPLLDDLAAMDARVEQARRRLLAWDHVLDKRSVEAGIYVAWENALLQAVAQRVVPPEGRELIGGVPLTRVLAWLVSPPGEFGANPTAARDSMLLGALSTAVQRLTAKLGSNMEQWQYGQPRYHHALIRHPLGPVVNLETRRRLEVGPLPRGGYGSTPNATGNSDNETSGASFRIIVDTGDWDRTVGTNTPGQSGDPDSPHYRDLFAMWANDRYFPVFYSRERVEKVTEERLRLEPGSSAGR